LLSGSLIGDQSGSDIHDHVAQIFVDIRTQTRKVGILAENGFNFTEIDQIMQALKKAGVKCEIVSRNLGKITSADGQQLDVMRNYHTGSSVIYDAVYVTGGRQCVDTLLSQKESKHFVNEAFKHAKAIGATNEGIDLLAASEIGDAPFAAGVVTIRNATDFNNFNQKFIEAIAQHRHWDR